MRLYRIYGKEEAPELARRLIMVAPNPRSSDRAIPMMKENASEFDTRQADVFGPIASRFEQLTLGLVAIHRLSKTEDYGI